MIEKQKKQISPEEAVMILQNHVDEGACDFDEDGSELEAYDMAAKALFKQLPKTIYLEGDGYSDGKPVYDMAICPECGFVIDDEYDQRTYHQPFCPHCGQAIEWNIEESKNEE